MAQPSSSTEEVKRWAEKAWKFLSQIREKSPLVQCITNYVSMDLMANILLAAGASPAMVHSVEEIPEFTPVVAALCVNIGTLTPDWLPAMKSAAATASREKKPWVLDPVAVKVSRFRMKACLELIELNPTVIRGNGSEIIALSSELIDLKKIMSGERGEVNAPAATVSHKGADSQHDSTDAVEAAKYLAELTGAVVAVTGAADLITDGSRVIWALNGVPMLQRITASGCAVTALIAAFVSVDPSRALEATASALSVYGVAAELGSQQANGPGSLRVNLIDSLYGLSEEAVSARAYIASTNKY